MDTYNAAPFPKLRYAYLRAVARAWRDHKYYLRLLTESDKPRGALELLELEYRFRFPFNVKLMFEDSGRPFWDHSISNWRGSADTFVIYLPRRPDSPGEYASVLARYSAEFPSLLGAAYSDTAEEAVPPDFADFTVMLVKLIAMLWTDPELELPVGCDDYRNFLQDNMDYSVPWTFRLQLLWVPGPSSTSDDYWLQFPRTTIKLHVPQKPEEIMIEPIALATYNASGSQYPFSCP